MKLEIDKYVTNEEIFLVLCIMLGIYINAYRLMLYREIMAVCSEIHTKHIITVCGQNVELLDVKLSVHIMTTVWYI